MTRVVPARWGWLALPWVVLAALLAISWYPFRIDAAPLRTNRIEVLNDGTLRFRKQSFAWTAAAPDWVEQAIESNSVVIALDVRPLHTDQQGPARIFTLSRNNWRRNITIGQEGTALIIRLRRPGSDSNGVPDFVVPGVFDDGGRHRIDVEIAGGRLRTLIDGVERLTESVGERALAGWDRRYRLALGNELTADRGWEGDIYQAGAGTPEMTVDYLEPGRLEMPPRHWRTAWLHDPESLTGNGGPRSVASHFVAFALLGAIFSLTWGTRISARGILWLAVTAALVTELGQAVLPDRHAAIADFAVNAAGVAAGGFAVRHLVGRITHRTDRAASR